MSSEKQQEGQKQQPANNVENDNVSNNTESGTGTTGIATSSSRDMLRESIQSDLSRLEGDLAADGALERASYRNSSSWLPSRVVFDSVTAQLGSIRQRLSRLQRPPHPQQTEEDEAEAEAETQPAAPAAEAPAAPDDSESMLLERLEIANLALTTGTPIGILQQRQQRSSTGAASAATANITADTGAAQATPKDDTTVREQVEEKAASAPARQSTLFASRREAEQQLDKVETYEGGYSTSISSTGTGSGSDSGTGDTKRNTAGSPDHATGGTNPTENSGDVPMEEVSDQNTKQADIHMDWESMDDIPETPILVTDKSRDRLDRNSTHSNLSGSIGGGSSWPRSQASVTTTTGSLVYSWGSPGENSLHDDTVSRPVSEAKVDKDSRIGRYTILSVSASPKHTAAVTSSGEILACGRNDAGQVAPFRKQDVMIGKPTLLESLFMTRIVQVSCGMEHTAALSSAGAVLTWGSNELGQLGHRRSRPGLTLTQTQATPNRFIHPAAMVLGVGRRAAAVACGHFFTLVLTTRMALLACGCEDIVPADDTGQPCLPTSLPALEALPLLSIAAGARHAVVLTCHGTAYAWGVNESGCCGREFPLSISVPVPILVPISNKQIPKGPSPFHNWAEWDGPTEPVRLSDDVAVAHAACGNSHTVLVTRSGHLLVCGQNSQHQIGLISTSNVTHAEPVVPSEKDLQFTCAEAGEFHTILLDKEGSVWQMGNGASLERVLDGKRIVAIHAGGQQSIAIAPGPLDVALQRRVSAETETTDGLQLAQTVETLVDQISREEKSRELVSRTEELFRYPAVMNTYLDPLEFERLYQHLTGAGTDSVRQAIATAIERGMQRGLDELRLGDARLIYPEAVRCLLLYLQCPLWRTDEGLTFDYRGDVIVSLCETFLNLPLEGYRAAVTWATSLYLREDFCRLLLNPLLAQLEKSLKENAGVRSRAIPVIVTVLGWFHKASEGVGGITRPEDFYSEAISRINPEALYEDLGRLKNANKVQRATNFFLCASPFLMSPTCKRNLLQIEHQLDMVRAATAGLSWDSQQRQFMFDPYFVLAIDRQFLLQQTLQKVAAATPQDLRKSLKIVFKGEEGIDAGGVTKEFFQLLSFQLFDGQTGMWSSRLDNNVTWFNSDCTWNYEGYHLVGVLVGLAVYNGVMLDVNFPTVVYRKLLGLSLGLEDMIDDSVRSGLHQLLDYVGEDVEEVFCLNFEVTWMDLGNERRVELKPNGRDIAVTSDNKEEYVLLYVKWLLVDSVQKQYEHFEKGVMQVLDSSSLDLLQPEEFELLVVGTPELDLSALETNTEYEGGYNAESAVVKNFWKFAKNADPETELKLLKFVTGNAMAPIGGLGALPFKIQRASSDSMQHPTSHTCFNTLLLPDYGDDYAKLERLLGRAIIECEGFGLQ